MTQALIWAKKAFEDSFEETELHTTNSSEEHCWKSRKCDLLVACRQSKSFDSRNYLFSETDEYSFSFHHVFSCAPARDLVKRPVGMALYLIFLSDNRERIASGLENPFVIELFIASSCRICISHLEWLTSYEAYKNHEHDKTCKKFKKIAWSCKILINDSLCRILVIYFFSEELWCC